MRAKVYSLVFVMLLVGSLSSLSQAQVTTAITPTAGAGDLGTTVTQAGSVHNITDGTRMGSNLFHSFGLFSVGAADTANFINNLGLPTSNSNIFSRVTGGNPSNIFGTIQTTGFGSASLYLINPAGVIFGSTASLNVGGSFHVSTADYLRMSDGNLLIANPFYEGASTSSGIIATGLSSASPAAFGFLDPNPAAIIVQNGVTLAVDPGQAISLIGGDITVMEAVLTTPGGQINLTSVAGAGEVATDTAVPAVGMALGTITLDQGTVISTVGDPSFGDGGGGAVSIRGGQFIATGAQISTNPAFGSTGHGGSVTITVADTASFTNATIDTSAFPSNGVSQNAGAIGVTASRLSLQDSTFLAEALGDGLTAGNGGAVTLMGTDSVTLVRSLIFTDTLIADGSGGAVSVTAPTITLEESTVLTNAVGDGFDPMTGSAGAVTVTGTTSVSLTRSFIGTETFDTTGSSGLVRITAPTVTIDGATLDASTHNSMGDPNAGNGGGIEITATNVTLSGFTLIQSVADSPGTFSQGGSIRINGTENMLVTNGTLLKTTTASGADAGNIELETSHLTVNGNSTLSSETLGPGGGGTIKIIGAENISLESGSLISTNSANGVVDQGPAGHIELNTQLLSISGGSRVRSETFGAGLGGTITVNANQAQLNNGSISAISTGTGPAGNIQITASDSLVMGNNSAITTATTQSDGGDITIQVGRLVQLTDSQITTSVQGGLGNGGNITIDPTFVILRNSEVIANAFGGNGGNISIVAGFFSADPLSVVSASSTLGISGTVNIQASLTNLSGTLAPLPGEFLQAASLLQARCAAQIGGQFSSLVLAGRDGLPLEPGGLLPSPLFIQSPGGTRLAEALKLPSLQARQTFGELDSTLVALSVGCAS